MSEDKPTKERRQAKRLPISAEGMLTILVPEETFTPQQARCVATDISMSGMRLKSYQLTKNDYLQMLKGLRHAKVALLDLPYLDSPLEIRAMVVWVEYHDGRGKDQPHCVLGLSFTRMEEIVLQRLEYVIDRLRAESGSVRP